MDRFLDLINHPVRALGRYASGMPAAASSNDAPLLRLNANESPYGPSPHAVAAVRAAIERSNWYPDDHSLDLRQKLAVIHRVQPEQILVANGTTSLLGVIARTILAPGLKAITSACSFISYPMVTCAAGATLVETALKEGGYDLAAILTAIDSSTRLVLIANPNNPTGSLLDVSLIDRFLKNVPSHVVVVLDEAYYDYAQHFAAQRGVEYSRSLDYVLAGQNVVVLRTFSKAHGLAGLRVGYGIGPAELMAYFARAQDTFAVSSMAQIAAIAAVHDDAHTRFAVEANAKQSEILTAQIRQLGYRVPATWANFLCFDVGQDAREFARALRREGVLIRPLGAWGAPQSIRVTIGTDEQNQTFLQALAKVSS